MCAPVSGKRVCWWRANANTAGWNPLHVVAILAAVLVRRGGELALVNVLMAALARCLGDLVDRVLALGDVALVASNRGVLAHRAGTWSPHARPR